MSLGQNIYRLRSAKKLSQEDFAASMEVSRQSVSKWENDMAVPELEKLVKMAKLFEISLDELVGNSPPQPASAPEPVPAATPAPPAGITTGDLISVVLLVFAVIFPVFAIFTIGLFNSWVILVIGLYIVPAAATFGAAFCSPNSNLLIRVYFVYDLIICIVGCLFMLGAPQLAVFTCLPTFGAFCFWLNRHKE